MASAFDPVIDALDVETFLACASESECKQLALDLAAAMNLPHPDIVFLEFNGLGARVRIRAYIHRPGSFYHWLEGEPQA